MNRILKTVWLTCLPLYSNAQTCCTGAAPSLGFLRTESIESKTFLTGILYEFNHNDQLYAGSKNMEDKYLVRNVSSLVTQIKYGLTDKLALSVILPYIWSTEENSISKLTNTAAGISDLSVLAQYQFPLKERKYLSSGIAVKVPTGSTTLKDDQNLFSLPVRMQPGTGSVDFTITSTYQVTFKFRPSMFFNSTVAYKINTTSRKFDAHDEYKFGNDFNIYAGVTDQSLIFNQIISYSLYFHFQQLEKDVQQGFENPNTGGYWLYIFPGITWSHRFLDLSLAGEMPIYRFVNGLQLTSSYRVRFSCFIKLNNKS